MEELLPLLPKLAEYGAVGIIAGVLYLVARLYHPQFATLVGALKELPGALTSLSATISAHSEKIEDGLGDVKAELAVIKDRLPRAEHELVRRVRDRMAAGD